MSRENVEIVRRLFDAWNVRDMAAFGELLDTRVVVRPPERWPEAEPVVGREAAMRQFEEVRETWQADVAELVGDPIDAGDRVLARHIWRGMGHGPESAMEWTGVVTVRRSRVVLIEYFWDHDEALEAAGLRE